MNKIPTPLSARRVVAPLGLAAAVCFGTTLPAEALVWRNDITDQQVQDLAEQRQFSGVGAIRTSGSIATGAAIAPGWVMTARHVVGNGNNVTFTLNGVTYAGTSISRPGSDVALVRLNADQQLPSNTVFISPNQNVDPVGELIWKVGLGQASSLANSQTNRLPSGTLRAGTNIVNSRQATFLDQNSLVFNNSNTAPNSTAFEVTTAPGDSGGPMLIQQNHQWFISGTTFGAIGGVGFVDSEVSPVFDWIETTTGITFAAQAAPTQLFWDGDTDEAGIQTGGGQWSTDRPNFYAETTGFNHTWENDAPITVVFGSPDANASLVTVADDITVSEIRFAPNADGSGPFQILDGTGTLRAAAGGATIDSQAFARINASITGSNDFTKIGSETLQFDGDNSTFAGELFINEGLLRTNNALSFGVGGFNASTRTTVADGATLQLNGSGITTEELIRLSGQGSTGSNGALFISQGDHNLNERMALLADATVNISANASATVGGAQGRFFNQRILTKTGGGTIIFDNLNNIAGFVAADGVVGGVGGINGSVTVQSGAEFRPGDAVSGAGLGTFTTDDLSLELGSTLAIDLDGNTADRIDITGSLSLAGALTLNLISEPLSNAQIVILSNDGSDAVAGQFSNGLTVAGLFGGVSYDFSIFTSGGDGNDVALQLIPEPTSAMLLLASALGLGFGRRRSRG